MTWDPQAISMQSAQDVRELFRRAAEQMLTCKNRRGASVHLPRRGRLLLTGDLHDNPTHLAAVRSAARLDRSPDNHVVLHELIHGDRLVNGVDLSYRMLCRVAQLVLEYPGQVHVVLANHELAQAFRQPVSKGAGDNLELFDAGLEWAFGDDVALVEEGIEELVRAMPLALRCDNGIMLSHSLPSPNGMAAFDPDIVDRPLERADYEHRSGNAWKMVWGRDWTPQQIQSLAERWKVRLFVLGHEHVEEGVDARQPNLLVLNTDHERGRVVPVSLEDDAPTADELLFHAMPVASLGAIDV
ncbi:MAG: metallophosphoesterase [Phycisphaerae bacterium]|nr:metallophosphoesterase [Phycisphaerae bacterium]